MDKHLNVDIDHILENHKRIAVVGLSEKTHRPSHRVARLMLAEDYDVIPVNPNIKSVFGRQAYPSLRDVPGPVDLVDIFRQPQHVDDIVAEAADIGAKAIWMQLGIINKPAAQTALDAGLQVVMDRCWAIEYRRWTGQKRENK